MALIHAPEDIAEIAPHSNNDGFAYESEEFARFQEKNTSDMDATILSTVNAASTANAADKYYGVLIHAPEEIAEIAPYSNNYGFAYKLGEFARFQEHNPQGLGATIMVTDYFTNESGLFDGDIDLLINEINQHKNQGQTLIILMDEPAWVIRLACQRGKKTACDDVAAGFSQTLATMEQAAIQFKANIPGIKIWHNMAYAELFLSGVNMIHNADLYSFDCYGAWQACGYPVYGYHSQEEMGFMVYKEMMRHESENPTGRKMMLIPGAYNAWGFPNKYAILSQLEEYKKLHKADFVAGSAIFYYSGYKDMPEVRDYIQNEYFR
ncbi:MAG: hypothetical protein RQ714_03035 [Nitrosomonas sp.]|nr:hypothetical protein [Nitrosomonas sp.]